MKKKIIIIIIAAITILIGALLAIFILKPKIDESTKVVDVSKLTYNNKTIKKYSLDEFNNFLDDYNNGKLPEVYITEFLFDGVSTYKTYDLDDFIESGNDVKVKALEATVFNVNTNNISFTGEITGGMIAVNTNNIKKDIKIVLDNLKLDTDSKKIPAIYVYNKDITYTTHKVTISAKKDTKNYIEGGKLKKISLIPSEKLSDYSNYYSSSINYGSYTNYYGVYTEEEINNILFAKVKADDEDLRDGDPYYYYKASGVISSDIDLYFEGEGYLEATSKNKEGIESKGNLTFSGGIGDYVIQAEDDCLNTTTDKSENTNARNTLTIDVNSMYAIVSLEADEGDAIDSNGDLIINGGTIIAIAKPGSDAGIDSETGTYINGGTVLATGDMYDNINSNSKQTTVVLSFGLRPTENTLITLLNNEEKEVFSYKTDRTYSFLIYSSPTLTEGDYYLYKDGTIVGEEKNGYYTTISSYEKGNVLAYSTTETNILEGPGEMTPMGEPGGMTPPEGSGEMTPPNGPGGMTPPDGNMPGNGPMQNLDTNETAPNKTFTINNGVNTFLGIANYSE